MRTKGGDSTLFPPLLDELEEDGCSMTKYMIELTAFQVLALYEMTAHAEDVIYRKAEGEKEEPGASYELVMSIQNKLDGCERLNNELSLIDRAKAEIAGELKEHYIPEFGSRAKWIR